MISYGYNMSQIYLRYAIAIADELHFTRAAENLHCPAAIEPANQTAGK